MTSVAVIMGDLANMFHEGLNYDIRIQYNVVRDDGRQYIYVKFVRGVYRGFLGEKPNRKFIFETNITKTDASRNALIDQNDFTKEQGVLTAQIPRVSNDAVSAADINPLLTKQQYKIKF